MLQSTICRKADFKCFIIYVSSNQSSHHLWKLITNLCSWPHKHILYPTPLFIAFLHFRTSSHLCQPFLLLETWNPAATSSICSSYNLGVMYEIIWNEDDNCSDEYQEEPWNMKGNMQPRNHTFTNYYRVRPHDSHSKIGNHHTCGWHLDWLYYGCVHKVARIICCSLLQPQA